MSAWAVNAYIVDKFYGGYVDYDERFYICPNCEEPVYECDWSKKEFEDFVCPICELEGGELT